MGIRIEVLLEAKGWSQAELARRVGIKTTTIWKLVNGQTQNSRFLHQIAKALGTTVEYLTGETDDPAPKGLAEGQVTYRGKEPGRGANMVEVAGIDLNFGLGGAFMDQEIVEHQAERLLFPAAWLRQITTTPAEHLYWTSGVGNSMEPAISDGDVILIDRSKVGSSFGDLYWAIAYGQAGMIKRLRPMPDGSVKILSDNQNVPPEIAYDGELHVFGRVVAVIRKV